MDITKTFAKTRNIDSVAKAAQRFESLESAKKRRRLLSNRERNSNNFVATSADMDLADSGETTVEQDIGLAQMLGANIPPPLEQEESIALSQKQEMLLNNDSSIVDPETYLASLRALKTGMDAHELEMLKKKTVEIDQITRQKVAAMTDSVKQMFLHRPDMIGCIPGLDNQVTLAFNLWLRHFKPAMKLDPTIGADFDGFARRLMSIQRDADIWRTFVEQWRMARILYNDNFGDVLETVKGGLGIAAPQPPINTENEQKEETVTL